MYSSTAAGLTVADNFARVGSLHTACALPGASKLLTCYLLILSAATSWPLMGGVLTVSAAGLYVSPQKQ